MSTDKILSKYVDVLYKAFLEDGIERCLSKAVHQFDTLIDIGGSCIEGYFTKLSEKNIALASYIFNYYKTYTEYMVLEINDLIANHISNQLNLINEKDFLDLYRGLQELHALQIIHSSNDEALEEQIKHQEEELYKLAELCFSSLIIDDNKLIHDVFVIIGNKIIDDASSNRFTDKFVVLTSSTNEMDRGRVSVKFLTSVYKIARPVNDDQSLKMVLRFKLQSTIVGKEYLSELKGLLIELLNNRNYNFLRHVMGCFPEITFNDLNTNEKELINKVVNEYPDQVSSKEFFCGLRISDKLNIRRDNSKKNLDHWWKIVSDSIRNKDSNAKIEYEFMKVYYCLRCMQIAPQHIDRIEELKQFDQNEFGLENICKLEQKAATMMICNYPDRVKWYINWLGNWNFYKFDENEEIFSRAIKDDNGRAYINILSKYYSPEDMIFIYMNSFLRSAVPINTLLRKLYEISDRKRDDYLMVKKIFKPYHMNLKLYMQNDAVVYEPVSFKTSDVSIYHFSGNVNDKLKVYYKNNKNDRDFAYVHFQIAATNVSKDFRPEIHLDYNEFINQDLNELNVHSINECINLLNKISEEKEISEDDIKAINAMPNYPLIPDNTNKIGMAIIRVCTSLKTNAERVSFLKKLKKNPFIYLQHKGLSFGKLKNEQLLKSCLIDVVNDKGSFEDKLFIYLNTALRMNVSLDRLIGKSLSKDNTFSLKNAYINQGLSCVGYVAAINNEENTYIIDVKPLNMFVPIYNAPKYVLITNEKIPLNTNIRFVIDHYNTKEKQFVIGDYDTLERRNTYYLDATAKARSTLDLTYMDRMNLQKRMDSISIKKNVKNLAVYESEAINLRKDDDDELYYYFELMKDGTPWRFSTKRLPYFFKNRREYGYIDLMLNEMIRKYDIDFVFDLYFNSSLKSFVSIDELFEFISKAEKLNEKVFNIMTKYPVSFYEIEDHVKGCNVLLKRDLDELFINDEFERKLYVVSNYDVKKRTVQFKLSAASK